MTHAAEMFELHPHDSLGIDRSALIRCVEECFACAQVCTACADACLDETQVADLVRCIRVDLDCAAICDTTGHVLSRRIDDTEPARALLEACAAACTTCKQECTRHANTHEHCACARRRADAASRHAGSCSTRSVDRPTALSRPQYS